MCASLCDTEGLISETCRGSFPGKCLDLAKSTGAPSGPIQQPIVRNGQGARAKRSHTHKNPSPHSARAIFSGWKRAVFDRAGKGARMVASRVSFPPILQIIFLLLCATRFLPLPTFPLFSTYISFIPSSASIFPPPSTCLPLLSPLFPSHIPIFLTP